MLQSLKVHSTFVKLDFVAAGYLCFRTYKGSRLTIDCAVSVMQYFTHTADLKEKLQCCRLLKFLQNSPSEPLRIKSQFCSFFTIFYNF